jgi:hypothetical protein
MGKCPKCGMGFGLFEKEKKQMTMWGMENNYHLEWEGQWLHLKCWNEENLAGIDRKRKTKNCRFCHYCTSTYIYEPNISIKEGQPFVSISDLFGTQEEQQKRWLEQSNAPNDCSKFGRRIESNNEAEKCSDFIIKEDYKRKDLDGEIKK